MRVYDDRSRDCSFYLSSFDMEKLNEEWTPRCVASYFNINHITGRPVGCNSRTDYIFSRTCGMGWRFALRYDDEVSPAEVEIYFDPNAADEELKNIRVATKHLDEGVITTKARDFDTLPKGLEMLSCWQIEDVTKNPQICFLVIFPPIDFTSETTDQTIPRKVLAGSMITGSFVDIQFLAVSRKLSSRTVGGLKSTFANSTLLARDGRPAVLDKYVVGSSIGETFMVLNENTPWPEQIDMDDYGYESDSDLSDSEDISDKFGSLPVVSLDNQKDEDEIENVAQEPELESGGSDKFIPDTPKALSLKPAPIRTTLFLKDIAHATWQALIYHAYASEIVFSRLKSEPKSDNDTIINDTGFRCSPKSMYRLADKLGLEELKKEAFKALAERITEDNVLEEVFSRFTSRYPEVLEMEVEALCKYWDSPKVVAEFPKKMARVASGGYPHSFAVLAKFSPPRLKN